MPKSIVETLPSYYDVTESECKGTKVVFLKARDCRLAQSHPQRDLVALKCIPRGTSVTAEVQNEVLKLRHLWHKHIIGFREVFVTTTHLCVVFDDSNIGSVLDLVNMKRRLPEQMSRLVFQQLITAVDYLHKQKVTNLHVNLNNLLFDGDKDGNSIVMCDFGFTKMDRVERASHLGPGYEDPDCKNGQPIDPEAADVWSCGVCLFYMLYGSFFMMRHNHLGNGRDSYQEAEVVIPDKVNGDGNIASEQCQDFLRKILQVNPAKRITMEEIWTHEWFQVDLPEGCRDYNTLTTDSEMLREHYVDVQSTDEILGIIEKAKLLHS